MTGSKAKDATIVGAALLAAAALGKPLWKRIRLSRVPLYKLKGHGIEVHVSPLGGIVQRLFVIDAHGRTDDIVLGFDNISTYLSSPHYFGAAIGRVCNRTARGKFTVEGQEYQVTVNNDGNHLHGGEKGWDKVLWTGRRFKHHEGEALELTYTSEDGEEGYPGTVEAKITYIVTPGTSLKVVFEATTDKTTPINMTQHSYFNLAGHGSGDVLNHKLQLVASSYTPKADTNVPTGEIVSVEGTPFDFSEQQRIGAHIAETGGGYDHNFVLFGLGKNAKFAANNGNTTTSQPKLAAQLEEPKSGRVMKVLTTAPGLQLYTGNFIDGVKGKRGAVYQKHAGLCLETQGFPNAVNQPEFPPVLLEPGQKYRHEVIYEFSVR